jgi:hypothetical protein
MADKALRHGQGLIHSFLALRKAVGIIGILLPFALLLVAGTSLGSISQGYYTAGSAVFVAAVCAIGIFLLFYRGYERKDRIASFIAGAAALVVAQVPCGCGTRPGPEFLWGWAPGYATSDWPLVHQWAAAILFTTLAVFCLFLFPLSDGSKDSNRKKQERNVVYYVCGGVIAVCLVAIVIDHVWVRWLGPTGLYVAETIMMLAFGFSWAVKGEAIPPLNDKAPAGPPLAPVSVNPLA